MSNIVYQCSNDVKGKYDKDLGSAPSRVRRKTPHYKIRSKWNNSNTYKYNKNDKYLCS